MSIIDLNATRSYFDDLIAEIRDQQDALTFYASPLNWQTRQTDEGFEPGPAVDGGERARSALS